MISFPLKRYQEELIKVWDNAADEWEYKDGYWRCEQELPTTVFLSLKDLDAYAGPLFDDEVEAEKYAPSDC